MIARTLVVLALAAALAQAAAAFSPGPPRPIPSNVTGVCSDGQDPQAAPERLLRRGRQRAATKARCASSIPRPRRSCRAARGVLTLIVDEDVAGFLDDTDASAERLDNARLTVLFELTKDGKPLAVAETFQLDRVGVPAIVECELEATDSSLCVPSWRQPITEANLIAATGEFQELGLQWAAVNANLTNALRAALLTPAELVGEPERARAARGRGRRGRRLRAVHARSRSAASTSSTTPLTGSPPCVASR